VNERQSAEDGSVEARSASLPWMRGAFAPRACAYAAAILAAFVLAYAIAASGWDPGPPAGASHGLPDQSTPPVQQLNGMRDVVPLPRLAPGATVEARSERPG
jgi:hypothetical protein